MEYHISLNEKSHPPRKNGIHTKNIAAQKLRFLFIFSNILILKKEENSKTLTFLKKSEVVTLQKPIYLILRILFEIKKWSIYSMKYSIYIIFLKFQNM